MTTNSQYTGTEFSNTLNDGETFTSPSYSYFDGNVGMSFNSQIGEDDNNNFYVGVAYHHFNKSKKVSFYNANNEPISAKTVVSAGVRINMSTSSFFTLQTDYSSQGPNKEIIGGALYSWKLDDDNDPMYVFHAGTYFRWKDAIIPVAKLECKPLAIAVSYDANISSLKQSSKGQGGFEISLTYQKTKKNNSSLDAARCPKF
jgi:hypothetical protein